MLTGTTTKVFPKVNERIFLCRCRICMSTPLLTIFFAHSQHKMLMRELTHLILIKLDSLKRRVKFVIK